LTSQPPIDQSTYDLLINEACDFDWAQISPTIFGAIFESTLNPDTRRKGGMHYTSIENIHKVSMGAAHLPANKAQCTCWLGS